MGDNPNKNKMTKDYKTKEELLQFLKDEFNASVNELEICRNKITDYRKIKKNDMRYGEMVDRVHLLKDVIQLISNLENIK